MAQRVTIEIVKYILDECTNDNEDSAIRKESRETVRFPHIGGRSCHDVCSM